MGKLIKGTKTEKNLLAAFAVSHRLEIDILTMPAPQKKKVSSRLLISFWKQRKMKKNTQKYFSNTWKEGKWRSRLHILPV